MNEKNVAQFKLECMSLFRQYNIKVLRIYGRHLGLSNPTACREEVLISDILKVLCGELQPARSNRGKPAKHKELPMELVEAVDALKRQYLCEEEAPAPLPEAKENRQYFLRGVFEDELVFEDSGREPAVRPEKKENRKRLLMGAASGIPVYRGQMAQCNGITCLLPEDGTPPLERIFVPVELIRRFDLREGDVIGCHGEEQGNTIIVSEILSVNDLCVLGDEPRRKNFDACAACYPCGIVPFVSKEPPAVSVKYVDWLMPVRKGQRGCIRSAPKTGKTSLLFDLAKATVEDHQVQLFVLLLDQPPEVVAKFRKLLFLGSLLYTTYEDDCNQQIYAAELILKRAKRYVESGYDVLLLIDSLNALARAYNETDESAGGKMLACGLESKTIHYLKKYFGTARCLERGGSLTILGAISDNTGNPADDVIASEISSLANYEMRLNESLAVRRIYPAIDYRASRVFSGVELETPLDKFMHKKFPASGGEQTLLDTLRRAKSQQEFYKAIKDVKTWE